MKAQEAEDCCRRKMMLLVEEVGNLALHLREVGETESREVADLILQEAQESADTARRFASELRDMIGRVRLVSANDEIGGGA